MHKRICNNRNGFTLVEVILAMAVLAIATAMITSVVYSLIYMKNNTYADNDTRGDIEIIEDYLHTISEKFDKNAAANYSYFSNVSEICRNCPETEEGVTHRHTHSVTFYDANGKALFEIAYNGENGTLEGKIISQEGANATIQLPPEFTYKFSGRIVGISMRCYDENGNLIDTAPEEGTNPKTGTLMICEIYFTNTKGRIQTYTVIISRKTTP